MKSHKYLTCIWSAGIAIFSMFFGSGNVVFPLLLGQQSGNLVGYALIGLTITAIGGPLLGLLGSVLFQGDCKQFFYRLGSLPGYIVVLLIICLIGPFGAMPRCVIVAYGAIKSYFPELSLLSFSVLSGVITLLLIWRRNFLLPILGLFLSPLLLISLFVVVIVGLSKATLFPASTLTASTALFKGLAVGYDTMDLLASIFFSVTVWMLLKEKLHLEKQEDYKNKLVPIFIGASLLGGLFLGIIYAGLSITAAAFPEAVQHVQPEEILTNLAIMLLGPKLAIVANVAIALACLTTVMGLAVTIVDVIHVEMMNTKIAKKIRYNYSQMAFLIVAICVLMSNLGFDTIMGILHPIMSLCYPAIIVLTVCNIAYKLYGFSYVKAPVYITFALTFGFQYLW